MATKAKVTKPADSAAKTAEKATKVTAAAKETKTTAKKTTTAAKKTTSTAKKTTAAKKTTTTAKKTTTKKAANVDASYFVQIWDKNIDASAILESVKNAWVEKFQGKLSEIKSVEIYIKPEENKAYFVINGLSNGDYFVEL